MPIEIARGVKARIRYYPDDIVLLVKGAPKHDEMMAALRRAATEIAGLDAGFNSVPGLSPLDANSPQYVEVLPSAEGPFIMVDGGHVPNRVLQTIPEIVVQHLQSAGITEATVTCAPEHGPLDLILSADLVERPRFGVALHLYPPPPPGRARRTQLPAVCLDEAAAWVADGLSENDQVWAKVVAVQFPLRPPDVPPLLRGIRDAESQVTIASGEIGVRMRGASLWANSIEPVLTIGAGGSACTDDDLLAAFKGLCGIARRLAAEVGYAAVDFYPLADVIHASGPWSRDWNLTIGQESVMSMCDEFVPDVYPYQILGPGHLQHLNGMPEGGRRIEGTDRVEVESGAAASWLLDLQGGRPWTLVFGEDLPRRDPQVQARGREDLAACLLSESDWLVYRRQKLMST